MAGLGLYELYINGKKTDDRVLAPNPTDYRKSVLYNTYDVTELVKTGSNVIGTVLGNGRFFTMRQNYKPKKIIVFSRDELKQFEMAQKFLNENRIRFFRDRPQIWITRRAFKCGYARIDSVDPITMLLECFVIPIRACLALIGDTHYGDHLLCEKILYEIIDF